MVARSARSARASGSTASRIFRAVNPPRSTDLRQLQVDDPEQALPPERPEGEDVVQAIEERRSKPPFTQDRQQKVGRLGIRLFDLIEPDHRKRLAPHLLAETSDPRTDLQEPSRRARRQVLAHLSGMMDRFIDRHDTWVEKRVAPPTTRSDWAELGDADRDGAIENRPWRFRRSRARRGVFSVPYVPGLDQFFS